jgi:hypothetical protein
MWEERSEHVTKLCWLFALLLVFYSRILSFSFSDKDSGLLFLINYKHLSGTT